MSDTESLIDLLDELSTDQWRQANPFSPDIEACHQQLFDPATSRQHKADALLGWLGSPPNQPCLFGRMAAKKGWLSICILTEADLARGDVHIRQLIQEHRRTWKREALSGKRHGFIILAVSRRLAYAQPGPVLQKMALRLCELYLSETGLNDTFHDSIDLGIDREHERRYRRWKVGVNLFASQADGRWWHDHRIPGGVAFSMNSVGHMARKLAEEAIQRNSELAERVARTPVGQLEALGKLSDFDEDRYRGKYHTDQTVPAEYFDPGQDRPAGLEDHDQYFTYLNRESDLDYQSMGLGEEILKTLQLNEEPESGRR